MQNLIISWGNLERHCRRIHLNEYQREKKVNIWNTTNGFDMSFETNKQLITTRLNVIPFCLFIFRRCGLHKKW